MHNYKEELFQNAFDLNETIVFEYDLIADVISFAENVTKYIPCSSRIACYLEEMELRGKIFPDDLPKAISFFRDDGDDTKIRMEYVRFLDYQGEFSWYQMKGKLIINGEGKASMLYGTFTCVDGKKEYDKDYVDAGRDPITKLNDRETAVTLINRYFYELPENVIPGVMIIDIDHFETWTKLYGLEKGNGLLIEIANILRKGFRGADIISKYGQDQFLVTLKGVRDKKVYCERATYVLDTVKKVWAGYDVAEKLTVSIGIAVAAPSDDAIFATLWDKALLALQEAKKKRNTFSIYDNGLLGAENFKEIRIQSKEVELVKSILDLIMTWAYAVDEQYHLIYENAILSDRIGNECTGLCYEKIKGYAEPCKDCPIKSMKNRTSSFDCMVYSPSLRDNLHIRTTKLVMRNQSAVYVLANICDDMETQIEHLNSSHERLCNAGLGLNDIIWDINCTRNLCIRIQEEHVLSLKEEKVSNYQLLRNYYLEHVVYQEDRDAFLAVTLPDRLRDSLKMGSKIVRREVRLLTKDQSYRWYSLSTLIMEDQENPGDELFFLTGRDVHHMQEEMIRKYANEEKVRTMEKRSAFQMEIAQSNERYEHVNELTGIFVFEYNMPEKGYYICSSFEDVFKVSRSMLVDEWSLLKGLVPVREDASKFEHFIQLVQSEPDTHEITIRLINRYDTPTWFTITVQTLNGINNTLTRVLGILQNVNTEMEIKSELQFRADYDSLTGLYNSEHFYHLVKEHIHLNSDKKFAIVAIDINHFRMINDRLGIETGNRCLQMLGDSIKQSLPWDGIAERYQADYFSALVQYTNESDLLSYMNKLEGMFSAQEAAQYGASLSFGIYVIDDCNIPVRLMCDRARLAKKEIKGSALCNYAVYDDKIRLMMREKAEMESEMQKALDHHEFIMYLQPKYDIHTEKICGAEALVRWNHPTKGIRLPGDFLPLFEDNGFIKKIDKYMWEMAAIYISKLKERGIEIPISVNISRIHIRNTELLSVLSDLVKRYEIEPRLLELEITENMFMEDVKELYNTMMDLKKAGFILEMDDFGSGYSSLNMLREAPVDVIKIDRFFLDEIAATKRGKIIVENSISMSKQLGLQVVAEGVETKEQLELVKSAGCDIVQGYYFSKPVSVEEFEKLLQL